MEEDEKIRSYFGSTKAALEHYFNNKVGGLIVLRRMHGEVNQELVERGRKEFIDGIELTIQKLSDGRISAARGIGEQQLRRLLAIAKEEDWTQVSTFQQLYRAYFEITGQEIDEAYILTIV